LVKYSILTSESGSPSFNNLSFISEIFIEFNLLSYIYVGLLGLFIGYSYALFKKRDLLGLLIYPMVFIGIFESYRLNFFFNPTFISTTIFIILSYFLYLRYCKSIRIFKTK
jgi:hypothetical protein